MANGTETTRRILEGLVCRLPKFITITEKMAYKTDESQTRRSCTPTPFQSSTVEMESWSNTTVSYRRGRSSSSSHSKDREIHL